MMLNCERYCEKHAWNLSGHCPMAFADNDGGFWCMENCEKEKTDGRKRDHKKSHKDIR